MSGDVTIPRETARAAAMILRIAAMKDAVFKGDDGTRYPAADLADLLDQRPADVSVTDAEHLSRAEARLDTTSPVIAIDPAMGVIVTEQVKTLFQVVAKSPSHGSAIAPCDCLICSAVHSLADTILSTPVPTPPAPSLRDEVILAIDPANGGGWESEADAVLALMLERVLNLPRIEWGEGGWNVRLDDLIALLGGES